MNEKHQRQHARFDMLRREWLFAAQEVTKTAEQLHHISQNYRTDDLAPDELDAMDVNRREDVNVTTDITSSIASSSAVGASTVVLETMLDLMNDDKNKSQNSTDDTGILLTSRKNQTEAAKGMFLSKRMAPKQKKSQQKSVFAGLEKNPESVRLHHQNQNQKRALLSAQRRELENALSKQSLNEQQKQQLLAARREHMLKLERLGLIPKTMASGPSPMMHSCHHRNTEDDS